MWQDNRKIGYASAPFLFSKPFHLRRYSGIVPESRPSVGVRRSSKAKFEITPPISLYFVISARRKPVSWQARYFLFSARASRETARKIVNSVLLWCDIRHGNNNTQREREMGRLDTVSSSTWEGCQDATVVHLIPLQFFNWTFWFLGKNPNSNAIQLSLKITFFFSVPTGHVSQFHLGWCRCDWWPRNSWHSTNLWKRFTAELFRRSSIY